MKVINLNDLAIACQIVYFFVFKKIYSACVFNQGGKRVKLKFKEAISIAKDWRWTKK